MCRNKTYQSKTHTNRLTSKSLKNKCVSAKLKIISSILRPNDTDVGGSYRKQTKLIKSNHIILKYKCVYMFEEADEAMQNSK